MNNDFDILILLLQVSFSILIFIKLFSKVNILKLEKIGVILFVSTYSIVFGLRDLSIGKDTISYIKNYHKITAGELSFENVSDSIFYILCKLNFFLGLNDLFILLLVSVLFMFNIGLFCVLQGKNRALILLFSYVCFFFFYNLGVNILRQGLAVSFFLCGIAYANKFHKRNIYFILAVLSHISSVSLVSIYFISKYVRTRIGILIFFSSIILSYFKFDFKFVLNLIPFFQRFIKYTDEEGYLASVYEIGFKLKFVIFNLFFLIVALVIKKYIKFDQTLYNRIFITYSLMSAIFFLSFNFPFSDRIGVYSWILIPLIIFPIFKYNYKNMYLYRILMFLVLIGCFYFIQ